MRAEESADEKTRQKTRLRRDGIFGTGFVARQAGKSSALPKICRLRPCRQGGREEEKREGRETGGGRRLCREERETRRERESEVER